MSNKNEYNGHPNRHYWSVALNISNDQLMYNHAIECLSRNNTLTAATRDFLNFVTQHDTTEPNLTSEGFEYTFRTVFRALKGLTSCSRQCSSSRPCGLHIIV